MHTLRFDQLDALESEQHEQLLGIILEIKKGQGAPKKGQGAPKKGQGAPKKGQGGMCSGSLSFRGNIFSFKDGL
jgi:hypothetical protein